MSLSEIETILSGGEIVPQSRIEKIIVGEDIVPQSRIEQLLKEILGGGGGGSSVPKPLTYDYMPEGYPKKNVQTATLMAERAVAFVDDKGLYYGAIENAFDIVIGQTYTVTWDGTDYECLGSAVGSQILLGNPSIVTHADNTGEPFVYTPAEQGFYTLETSASHTISVKTTEETVTPMAAEFLPAVKNTTVFYI